MMSEFYRESGYGLDHGHAEKAFSAILSDDRLGYVWLIEDVAIPVGYIVLTQRLLTQRFAMEYGGLLACIDDLFVVPQRRNQGLSTRAMLEVRDFCQSIGIRAITVEVGYGNQPAQAVYRWIGW